MSIEAKALQLAEQGYTHQQIADMCGCSRQRIHQVCGKPSYPRFQPYTAGNCIYPNFRDWLNENKVSRHELSRRIGQSGLATHVSKYLSGKINPNKATIDRMLEVTGLTYEKLFYMEEKRK